MLATRTQSKYKAASRPIFRQFPWLGLALSLILVGLGMLASLVFGVARINVFTVFEALFNFNNSQEHNIITLVRVPRVLIATAAGAGLGVAGAIMQALTRNPLASPGILGINAGASLAVVLALFLLKISSLSAFVWFAFAGAALAAAIVYGIGSLGRGGLTPLKLTVGGAALTALFASFTQAVLVLNESTLDEIRFWLVGSVAGRNINIFWQVIPYAVAGLLLGLIISRQLTALSLGEDIARGLGQRTIRVKLAAGLAVVILAGSAVALAGPVGFVGLVVPHFARFLVGVDYRWIIPYSALLGAALLLFADVGARFILFPSEVPVGAVTAVIGAPLLIWLIRRKVGLK
jgi:iron complex transport system permease protein